MIVNWVFCMAKADLALCAGVKEQLELNLELSAIKFAPRAQMTDRRRLCYREVS